jgi:hypothetical protein
MHSRNGQAWYLDVVIAVFIFTAGIVAYQYYSLNMGNTDKERLKGMSFEADALSSGLLEKGYPEGWNESTVIKIGIGDGEQRLDRAQWQVFSRMNYNESKQLLGMTYDFVIFFDDRQGNVARIDGICGIGMASATFSALNDTACSQPFLSQSGDLIARERYLLAKGKIIRMKVYVLS